MTPQPHARRRSFIVLCTLMLVAALIVAAPRYARASPSDKLSTVLGDIRDLLSIDFGHLTEWARNGHPTPENPAYLIEKAEAAINDLDGSDRDAVLAWLQGKGRGKLHDAGASDFDIGPARPGIDSPNATATPNAWRNVPLATATLDEQTVGKIQILGGFAAVKKDGTSAIACVSFKNVDARVAKRVVFEFPLLGSDGPELGKLTLDRNGEFSPNTDIRSFDSMGAWQGGAQGGPVKSYGEGCIQRDLPTAAIPFLQARAVGYRVVHVEYADGTSWGSAPVPQ